MSDRDPPLIVTVAPNGAYKTPADHPALPVRPEALANTAAACLEAGAAMLHLHVRDARGRHTLDAAAYEAAIAAVRAATAGRLVIQVTSEAANRYSPPEQMAAMRALAPEALSLAIREIVPDTAAEPAGAEFLAWVAAERILPQYILYSASDVARYRDLLARGVVPDTPHLLLFVLGRYTAGQVSSPLDLVPFLGAADPATPWAMCAFGAREHACALAAAALGGHVRVGFENNLLLKDGSIAPDNAALVRQVREGADVLGRPLADAETLRERFRA